MSNPYRFFILGVTPENWDDLRKLLPIRDSALGSNSGNVIGLYLHENYEECHVWYSQCHSYVHAVRFLRNNGYSDALISATNVLAGKENEILGSILNKEPQSPQPEEAIS